jgi:hypothetical protein
VVSVSNFENPYIMHEKDISRLSDLLEGFIWHHSNDVDSKSAKDRIDERLLMKALEIINGNLKAH